jgi:hypothetical protein
MIFGSSPEGKMGCVGRAGPYAIIEAKPHDHSTTVNTIYLVVEERDHDRTIRVRSITPRARDLSAQPIFLKLAERRDTKSVVGFIQSADSTFTDHSSTQLRYKLVIRQVWEAWYLEPRGSMATRMLLAQEQFLELKLVDLHVREEVQECLKGVEWARLVVDVGRA